MTRVEKERLLAEIEKQYKWLMTKSPIIYMMDIAFDAIRKAVRDEASKEQQEPRWIPISEKLPETDGNYLLFGKVVGDEDAEYVFIGTYDACAEKFGYWEDYYDRNTLGFLDSELIEYNKVIAWMPLPKPYKPQESEDKE